MAPGNINIRNKNSWKWKETQFSLGKNQTDFFFLENEAAEQKNLGREKVPQSSMIRWFLGGKKVIKWIFNRAAKEKKNQP